MLDVEVIPGKSVGEFRIGMPISSAIAYIQKNYKTISSVELKYCEEDLLNTYVLIDLSEEGLLLRFEPRTQRLHSIEVYDLTRVVLRYCGVAFSGPDTLPTFVLIYDRFGPSFPGDYNRERQTYCLGYPGVTFTFPIPNKWKHFDEAELPIEFSDGTTPTAARMVVYHGEKRDTSIPPLDLREDYFEELQVYASHGIKFMRRGCRLDFQSTAQDVLTELGRPDRTFYKHEDKMRIHSGDQAIIGAGCEDYFYNYFKLGLDILFDMRTHHVKKFILHTNFPCHNDFNVYNKCNFKLFFGSPEELDSASEESEEAAEDKSVTEPDERQRHQQQEQAEQEEEQSNPAEDEDEDEEEDDEETVAKNAKALKANGNAGPRIPQRTHNGGAGGSRERDKRKDAKGKQRMSPHDFDDDDENVDEAERDDDDDENGRHHRSSNGRVVEEEEEEGSTNSTNHSKGKGKSQGKNKGSKNKGKGGSKRKSRNGNPVEAAAKPSPHQKAATSSSTRSPAGKPHSSKEATGQGRDVPAALPAGAGGGGFPAPATHIHPDLKWEEMQQVLPGPPSKPVVNTTTSPFGSTLFYGHKDLIFEVMRNGHVASICMFSAAAAAASATTP